MVDTAAASSGANFQQLDVDSYVTSMALSPQGDYLAFGDAYGQLHLWTDHDTGATNQDGSLVLPPFNGYEGAKPEWPDSVDPPPRIAWEEST